MPKKIYRVEIELRVTSLGTSLKEVPVGEVPKWEGEFGIIEFDEIETKNFKNFKGHMLYYGLAALYRRMGEQLKNMKPKTNKKTTLV